MRKLINRFSGDEAQPQKAKTTAKSNVIMRTAFLFITNTPLQYYKKSNTCPDFIIDLTFKENKCLIKSL